MKNLLVPLLLILFLVFNLAFIIIIRRTSKELGGAPQGFHIYYYMRYIYNQDNDPKCRNLKSWIRAYVTLNAIAFAGMIVLFASGF